LPDAAQPLDIMVDDDTETIRVDPVTGTVEHDQPDGGTIVQFNARKPKKEGEEESDWFCNLAEDMDQAKLAGLANDLIDAIEADDRSRGDYLAIRARGLDLLGIKLEEPKASVADGSSLEGLATVTNPLLLEAILKGWANAEAELLPSAGPVKIKDDGDETVAEDDLAESLQRDTNHWFTTVATEYYPETSHMLLWGVYFGGSGIKKVYRCPIKRRPVSKKVDVEHLIVSNTETDFASCGRITHQIMMRPSVMKRMKFIGAYRDVALTQPTPAPNQVTATIAGIQGTATRNDRPEDQPYTVLETQCELDLDEFIAEDSQYKGEGIPLPYLVTIDKDSREVLALRRDWDEDDPECERKRMYVKYPYVPGPGFYGTGMLNILGNASAAMTAAWREALDAGMFANFPGGLISKGAARQNSSLLRPGLGEFVPVETSNLPIGQVVMGMPYRDVTPGLMALMDRITEQSKAVSGAPDIPVAEGVQNVPVGTMLAAVEQATKIMAAAHKGMHIAQSEELQLVLDLFRANPEDFWRNNKTAPRGYWNEQKLLTALNTVQLIPVSDPNVPSHIHRVAKALALIQLSEMPQFAARLDPDEVLKRALAAIREDPRGLVVQPPPQNAMPDPKALEAHAKVMKAQSEAAIAQAKQQALPQELAAKERETQAKVQIAESNVVKEKIIHSGDAIRDAHTMEIDQRDQGLKELKAAADVGHQRREHALDVASFQHEAGMDVAQHQLATSEHQHAREMGEHERQMGQGQLAVDKYTATHPPKPAGSKPKPKGKS
jgi:hypothetical protein